MHNPPTTKFSWARNDSGQHKATVDGIEYTVWRRHRNRRHRWDMEARVVDTGVLAYATESDTASSLRAYAVGHHRATLDRLGMTPPPPPAPPEPVSLGTAVLEALHLPDSSLELQHQRGAWYACLRVQLPGRCRAQHLVAYKPSAAESLGHLEHQVAIASAPGGVLAAELADRRGR